MGSLIKKELKGFLWEFGFCDTFWGRLKKQAFATDWVLSGSKSSPMMGYHNHFCLGGRRKEEGLKLQLVKNQ